MDRRAPARQSLRSSDPIQNHQPLDEVILGLVPRIPVVSSAGKPAFPSKHSTGIPGTSPGMTP